MGYEWKWGVPLLHPQATLQFSLALLQNPGKQVLEWWPHEKTKFLEPLGDSMKQKLHRMALDPKHEQERNFYSVKSLIRLEYVVIVAHHRQSDKWYSFTPVRPLEFPFKELCDSGSTQTSDITYYFTFEWQGHIFLVWLMRKNWKWSFAGIC